MDFLPTVIRAEYRGEHWITLRVQRRAGEHGRRAMAGRPRLQDEVLGRASSTSSCASRMTSEYASSSNRVPNARSRLRAFWK